FVRRVEARYGECIVAAVRVGDYFTYHYHEARASGHVEGVTDARAADHTARSGIGQVVGGDIVRVEETQIGSAKEVACAWACVQVYGNAKLGCGGVGEGVGFVVVCARKGPREYLGDPAFRGDGVSEEAIGLGGVGRSQRVE